MTAPPRESETDDLVQRLRVRSINVWDAPFALRDEAADTIERQASEIESLRAECGLRQIQAEAERDRANADAARYRWLRGDAPEHSERWMRWCLQRWDGKCWHSLERAALDAAIDAHLKGKP